MRPKVGHATQGGSCEQLTAWRDCITATFTKRRMFPLGGMRAPEDGWLVVQGRRGHYGFCDEIRAYDLKTGAFYATQSCGGLALRNDGSVDQGATDAGRKPRQIVGRIPLLALREVAWMIFMADELSEPGLEHPPSPRIPESLRIGWPPRARDGRQRAGRLGHRRQPPEPRCGPSRAARCPRRAATQSQALPLRMLVPSAA